MLERMKTTFRAILPFAMLAGLVLTTSSVSRAACEPQLKAEVSKLTTALLEADRSTLRTYWPNKGKVLLNLQVLGPEDGYFSSAQADVVLSGALASKRIVRLNFSNIEADEQCFAVVQGSVVVETPDGVHHDGRLRVVLQPAGESWEIREIRESRR